MINSDVIRLLLLISLPFLIDKGREFMRQRELNLQKPKRNKTKFDYFIIILLLSNCLLQTCFAIFLRPPNIYRDTGVPLKVSTSILRTILTESNNKTTFTDKEQTLLKKLESYENRLLYVTYGEEALLECSYCYNLTDYLMFIIPNIAWSYVIMTSILGVSTMLKRKSHWRTYGVIWLVGSQRETLEVENYINYRPSAAGKDDNGIKRMNLIAQAAESIGDGDIINVQIRRYQQWQLFQSVSLASCIIPAALMRGQRETLEVGERNFNRFGGWLGKNSTMRKNLRLLEDLHVHVLASHESNLDRATLRVDFLSHLLKHLTDPLRSMSKDAAVKRVVEFMGAYSLSQEDFDTIVELSKFKGQPNPLDGIQPAVKAALTKAYNQGSSARLVRAADLVTLPGMKKAPKKRVVAMLETEESGFQEENRDTLVESEEENFSETEDPDVNGEKLQLDLQSNESKGIQVQLDLKNRGSSNAKKNPVSKSRGSQSAEKGGRGSGAVKRKR